MRTISIAVFSLGVCALAMASEYQTPTVKFNKALPSKQETKMADFNDNYKVEGEVKADRQIASEKDSSDRGPSSTLEEKEKDKVSEKENDGKIEPKPWLYRNRLDSAL